MKLNNDLTSNYIEKERENILHSLMKIQKISERFALDLILDYLSFFVIMKHCSLENESTSLLKYFLLLLSEQYVYTYIYLSQLFSLYANISQV